MKKLFLAAQLLFALGLTSCGQEDTPITHQRATTGERITLSADFALDSESGARAMIVSSGGTGRKEKITWEEDEFVYSGQAKKYDNHHYSFASKVAAKAVFSAESTEPVTLVFYHGGKAYPVESQISLKKDNGHYHGKIEATLPSALSGVKRSDIQVAGVLGATSVDATTGKVTVTAPPAIVEGDKMQTMPMYFPKTTLSASSDHLEGVRFRFLGALIVVPISSFNSDYSFVPEEFTLGPERFTESQVEVDLSAGGEPKLTRTASSTYVHPMRRAVQYYSNAFTTHILYVFPVSFDSYKFFAPAIYGKCYPTTGDDKYTQGAPQAFVVPRAPSRMSNGIGQGSRLIVYDMTLTYYNGNNGRGYFKGDYQKNDYLVFSGRNVGTNIPGRGWDPSAGF